MGTAARTAERIAAMETSVRQVELRNVAIAGISAGLIFAGFEVIATAIAAGPESAAMPVRMISAILLGPATLESGDSLGLVAITSIVIHLVLAVIFASIFAVIVTRVADATAGELLTSSAQLAVAGTMFGTVLWLVNFYVIARLAGWTWFPGDAHHVIAFVGHAFFFGCPLGWMYSRLAERPLVLQVR
jgi:hypothetical protein